MQKGDKAGLIPVEDAELFLRKFKNHKAWRLATFGFCGVGVYYLPLDLDLLFSIPTKFILFWISRNTMVIKSEIEFLESLQLLCDEHKLIDKVGLMNLDEKDKKHFNSLLENLKRYED